MIHFFLYVLKANLIIPFLIIQLQIFARSKGKLKFSPTPKERIDLILLYKALNRPLSLCFAFSYQTFDLWVRQSISKNSSIPQKKGRPEIIQQIKELIVTLKIDNPINGYTKLVGELLKLGISVSRTTIRNILRDFNFSPKPKKWFPSFSSILNSLYSMDFKIIQSGSKKIFTLFIIRNLTREIEIFNTTLNPNPEWLKNQLRSLTDGSKKLYLITDNDILYENVDFSAFNIKRLNTKPRSPLMNAFIERFIGSFNREALVFYDKSTLTLDKVHKISKDYVNYYNNHRPHQGIGNITIPQYKKVLQGQHFTYKTNNHFKHEITNPFENLQKKQFLDGHINHYYLPHQKTA